jgi:hypothetical protein
MMAKAVQPELRSTAGTKITVASIFILLKDLEFLTYSHRTPLTLVQTYQAQAEQKSLNWLSLFRWALDH